MGTRHIATLLKPRAHEDAVHPFFDVWELVDLGKTAVLWRAGRFSETSLSGCRNMRDLLYAVAHGQTEMSAMVRRSPTRYPEPFFASAVSMVRYRRRVSLT